MKPRFTFMIITFCVFSFASLFGCRNLYDISDNIGRTFSSPAKIKNKNPNPVKDNVKLSALWVGHATMMIQIYDKVIITDPFFTEYIAQIQKRVIEPGLDIGNLKKCDLILISHSHFDHCNISSLKLLEEKFSGASLIFPKGVEEFLPGLEFSLHAFKKGNINKRIYTGETKIIEGMKITSVIAYHWGGRYGIDGLIWGYDGYCGFIIEYKDVTVYFSGDTSYDDNFYKYLGDNFNIDLAIVPIGPCGDCYKVDKKNRHVYPKGALKILEDTKAEYLIPVHYGTIRELSEPDEPKAVLEELIKDNLQYSERVKILKIGEQFILHSE